MSRRAHLSVAALVMAVVSAATVAPAEAASGVIIKRVYQSGANWSTVTFNPVVDSNGAHSLGRDWARKSCKNITQTVKLNVYFTTLRSTSGYLRTAQIVLDRPSATWDMYQASSAYYNTSGKQVAGPRKGYTTFFGGRTTAVALPFERTVQIDKSSRRVQVTFTLVPRANADEAYCGTTFQIAWYKA